MLSIKNDYKYEEVIKKSRFISLLFKVKNSLEINKYMSEVKAKYPNATHYCYAYILDNDIKFFDDGEPSKTAGFPILKVIQGYNLNYILLIVVRYFGGIKLGTGLLTRTYSKMAKEVVNSDNIITLEKGFNISITFNFSNIKEIDYLLKDSKIIDKSFEDGITYIAEVSKDLLDKLKIHNVKVLEEIYIEKK